MIIFGTRTRHKKVDEGEFFCPRCQASRHYTRKQATNFFTLYFIPLIPLKKLGEYVECETCHMAFPVDVLTAPPRPAAAAPPRRTDDAVSLLNGVKSRLEKGYPVEYMVRDLTSAGLNFDVARSAITSAVGTTYKKCKTCGLSYAQTAGNCAECGGSLTG